MWLFTPPPQTGNLPPSVCCHLPQRPTANSPQFYQRTTRPSVSKLGSSPAKQPALCHCDHRSQRPSIPVPLSAQGDCDSHCHDHGHRHRRSQGHGHGHHDRQRSSIPMTSPAHDVRDSQGLSYGDCDIQGHGLDLTVTSLPSQPQLSRLEASMNTRPTSHCYGHGYGYGYSNSYGYIDCRVSSAFLYDQEHRGS